MPFFYDSMPKKKKKTVASTKKTPKKTVEDKPVKTKKRKIGFFSRNNKKHSAQDKQETKVEKAVARTIERPNTDKPKKQKKKISPVARQKIRGGILILIGLFAISFIGWFLFGKLFSPQDIAELSPAEKTIAVMQVSIDGNSGQVSQFYELMDKYAVYRKDNIIKLLESAVPFNYQQDLYPWLGRQAGVILFDTADMDSLDSLSPIYFVESRDQNATLKFLNEQRLSEDSDAIIEKDYAGRKIYQFTQSQKAVFTFVNNYLVLAEDEKLLNNYLDHLAESSKLSDDENYRKVANNLPRGGIAYGYVDFKRLIDTLEKDKLFLNQKGQELLVFKPFLDVFKAEGLSIFVENGRFTAQTFTAIDNDVLNGESYITFSEKYQGELLAYANQDPIFLIGGHDLTKEINRLEDVFKSGTKTPALVFEGLLEAQKQQYFGKDLSLEEDILPLLTGEYLLTVENSFEDPEISIFIELQDKTSDIPKFEKAVNAFVEVSGLFTPKIQQVELPDGTIGQEIVASPEKIEKSTSKYKTSNITTLKLGDTGIKLSYAILGDIVALSTDLSSIHNIVDRYEGDSTGGLTAGNYYKDNVAPVLRTADEVMLLKLGALTEATGLNADQDLGPYVVPFNNLTITKNYFQDGVSTIYLVEII